MPVKRRNAKRRLSPAMEAQAWSCVFETRHDFFGDMREIAVPTDHLGDPDRATAEEAWHRLGPTFLDQRDPREGAVPWAVREFGDPHAD